MIVREGLAGDRVVSYARAMQVRSDAAADTGISPIGQHDIERDAAARSSHFR